MRSCDKRHSVGKMGTPRRCRETEIAKVQARLSLQMSHIALHERSQGRGAARRERQQMAGPFALGRRQRFRGWGFLKHHMRVRAAHPKGTDCSDLFPSRPRRPFGRHSDSQTIPLNVRIGLLKMQVGSDLAVLHAQDDLDQPGNPSRLLQVADVGLDRPDPQRRLAFWCGAVDRGERVHLDRVAQLRARPMCLDIPDRLRVHGPVRQRLTQQGSLRSAVRHGQPTARAVMVGGAAANHSENRVALRLRVAEPLEHHNPTPFAIPETICRGVEGLAAPIRSQGLELRQRDQLGLGEDQVDTARQRQIGAAAAQALTGQMDADQRGRTGGVDDQIGALQPQDIRQSARSKYLGVAGTGVRAGALLCLQQRMVLAGCHTDIDTGSAVLQRGRRLPGMLQRLPAHFEQQPLLRIQQEALARGQAEEVSVEVGNLVEQGCSAHI